MLCRHSSTTPARAAVRPGPARQTRGERDRRRWGLGGSAAARPGVPVGRGFHRGPLTLLLDYFIALDLAAHGVNPRRFRRCFMGAAVQARLGGVGCVHDAGTNWCTDRSRQLFRRDAWRACVLAVSWVFCERAFDEEGPGVLLERIEFTDDSRTRPRPVQRGGRRCRSCCGSRRHWRLAPSGFQPRSAHGTPERRRS